MLKKQCPDSGLARALSTIASPVFSDVTVLYRDYDIRGAYSPHPNVHPPQKMSQAELAREAKLHLARFGMYRAMHEVRDFRLVLCADVWDGVGEYAVRMLKEAVVAEKVARGFDTFPEPEVTYSPRLSRPMPPPPPEGQLEWFWDDKFR